MKHYKSVFENEQELLKALIDIHLDGKNIECDPMFFKGNFYKNGIEMPKYCFDINPIDEEEINYCLRGMMNYCVKGDVRDLPLESNSLINIILDPPFLFGIHGKTKEYYSSQTHTIFKDFEELENLYKAILKEAHRLLKKKGILIFKCQDYTDNKTTMTHALVYNWATE